MQKNVATTWEDYFVLFSIHLSLMCLSCVDVTQARTSPNRKNRYEIDLKMNVIVMYEACSVKQVAEGTASLGDK